MTGTTAGHPDLHGQPHRRRRCADSGAVAARSIPSCQSTRPQRGSGTLVGNDVDGDTLTYGISEAPPAGRVTPSAPTGRPPPIPSPAPTSSPRTPPRSKRSTWARTHPTSTRSRSATATADRNQTYTVNITGENDATGVAPTDIKFALNEANATAQGSNLNAGTAIGSLRPSMLTAQLDLHANGCGSVVYPLARIGTASERQPRRRGSNVGTGRDYTLIVAGNRQQRQQLPGNVWVRRNDWRRHHFRHLLRHRYRLRPDVTTSSTAALEMMPWSAGKNNDDLNGGLQ